VQVILVYLLCGICGVVIFLVAAKLGLAIRIASAIGTVLVLAAVATAIRVHIGDRPAADAVTVDQKQLQRDSKKPAQ
jgi:hypothetical protein